MSRNFQVYRIIIFVINLLITGLVLWRVKAIHDDRAILIFIFYYPALILINGVTWILLRLSKNIYAGVFGQNCLTLLVLFFPLLF